MPLDFFHLFCCLPCYGDGVRLAYSALWKAVDLLRVFLSYVRFCFGMDQGLAAGRSPVTLFAGDFCAARLFYGCRFRLVLHAIWPKKSRHPGGWHPSICRDILSYLPVHLADVENIFTKIRFLG